MAILPDCPGLKVEIIVDEQPLHEYADDTKSDKPKDTTRYVEAQSGKAFAIKYFFSDPFPPTQDVSIKILIVGVQRSWIRRGREDLFAIGGHEFNGETYNRKGRTMKRNYTFDELEITEDDRASKELIKKVATNGIISISFEFCELNGRYLMPNTPRKPKYEQLGIVPEKAMKGDEKSHQAGLAPPEVIDNTENSPFPDWDIIGDDPIASFHFQYRSMKSLQDLHIIPAPVPLEDRPILIGALDLEKAQELLCRRQQDLEVVPRIKKEEITMPEATRDNPIVIPDDDTASVEDPKPIIIIDEESPIRNEDVPVVIKKEKTDAPKATRDDPLVLDGDSEAGEQAPLQQDGQVMGQRKSNKDQHENDENASSEETRPMMRRPLCKRGAGAGQMGDLSRPIDGIR